MKDERKKKQEEEEKGKEKRWRNELEEVVGWGVGGGGSRHRCIINLICFVLDI